MQSFLDEHSMLSRKLCTLYHVNTPVWPGWRSTLRTTGRHRRKIWRSVHTVFPDFSVWCFTYDIYRLTTYYEISSLLLLIIYRVKDSNFGRFGSMWKHRPKAKGFALDLWWKSTSYQLLFTIRMKDPDAFLINHTRHRRVQRIPKYGMIKGK
jgi:hypothetical protein